MRPRVRCALLLPLAHAALVAADASLDARYQGPSCGGALVSRTLFPAAASGCVALSAAASLSVRCDNSTSGSQLLFASGDCSGAPLSTTPLDLTPCAQLPDGSSHEVTCVSTGYPRPSTGYALTVYAASPDVTCAAGGAAAQAAYALGATYVDVNSCLPNNESTLVQWACGSDNSGSATFYPLGSGCVGTPLGVQQLPPCGAVAPDGGNPVGISVTQVGTCYGSPAGPGGGGPSVGVVLGAVFGSIAGAALVAFGVQRAAARYRRYERGPSVHDALLVRV
jgi:hypothetical protein